MTNQKLLQIKKQKKAQKPAFLRRNFKKNKRTRVTGEWRAPRGLHNKLRRRRRGVGQWVMPGYRMPVAVRGLTVEGLRPVVVENVQQMSALTATDIAILKSSAGKKNRILMIQEAVKKNIQILNMKDPSAFLKKCEEEKVQTKSQEKPVTAEQKKADSKKTEEKKEVKEEKSIDDLAQDKKKQEQKQKNKILTKKE